MLPNNERMEPQANDLVIYEAADSTWELSAFPWRRLGVYTAFQHVMDVAILLARQEHIDLWHTTDQRGFRQLIVHR